MSRMPGVQWDMYVLCVLMMCKKEIMIREVVELVEESTSKIKRDVRKMG